MSLLAVATFLAITPLGAFAISLAINLVLTAATLLTRPRGKDRRTDGFGADTPANDDDPTQPMAMVYGRPSWVPPVIARFFRIGDSADPFVPQAPAARVVVLSVGAGPTAPTAILDGEEIRLA